VSHTAFSHVIDYVFDGHDSQSYHDEEAGSLPGTQSDDPGHPGAPRLRLARFSSTRRRYPLLEQPAPRLCADRLDYFSARQPRPLGLAAPQEIEPRR
jgi:uncharacterized protein